MDVKCKPASHLLRKARYSQLARCYLITTVTDHRKPVFNDFILARCLIKVLRDLHDAGVVEIMAFVVMLDHLHCLLVLSESQTLSDAVRLIKGRSARLINEVRNESGKLWQPGFHDHALRDGEQLDDYVDYILANPVRKMLVENISQYPHWDVLSDGYFNRG
jgi:REP element-mobilizing transposase RayT